MHVWLMRHPPVTARGICYGRLEVGLAEPWRVHLDRARRLLAEETLTVYSSPSKRCRYLAEKAALKPCIEADLTELDFGCWEGRSWGSIPDEELRAWSDDLENARPHGGETGVELIDRAARFWSALRERDEDTLLITHQGWLRALLAHLLDIPLLRASYFTFDYGSLSLISQRDAMTQIVFLNRT